jgi:hypothetical protein
MTTPEFRYQVGTSSTDPASTNAATPNPFDTSKSSLSPMVSQPEYSSHIEQLSTIEHDPGSPFSQDDPFSPPESQHDLLDHSRQVGVDPEAPGQKSTRFQTLG